MVCGCHGPVVGIRDGWAEDAKFIFTFAKLLVTHNNIAHFNTRYAG